METRIGRLPRIWRGRGVCIDDQDGHTIDTVSPGAGADFVCDLHPQKG